NRFFGDSTPGQWLAVTSMCFDISVLELFWTLTHGDEVVLHPGLVRQPSPSSAPRPLRKRKAIDFGLLFFSAVDHAGGEETYKLLLEAARFADEHGFSAVWTPERHFHSFGGIYPNPAVTSAAIAAITRNVAIRAGSVVLPLHDPIRVAEEWCVIDNLSGGRVQISFAPGWATNDFVLAPARFDDRRQSMFRDIETVRSLWRGNSVSRINGAGREVSVEIYPKPVQSELPVWLTAAGNPETFQAA